MATFEKETIVRNVIHYRKHVKHPHLYRVEDSWTDSTNNEWLTLTHLQTGRSHRNIPAETMQTVSTERLQKMFDVSTKSVTIF